MNKGFTLIEVLITMAILSGVVIVITFFGLDVLDFGNFLGESLGATEELQQTLIIVASEIRSMANSDAGAYKITVATSTTLTFYSDVDGDGSQDRVRYFLDGNVFKKGVIEPVGNPAVYDPATETIKELVHDILPGSPDIFTYFDQGYDGIKPALPFPTNPSLIRVIRVQITVDPSPQDPVSRNTRSITAKIRSI